MTLRRYLYECMTSLSPPLSLGQHVVNHDMLPQREIDVINPVNKEEGMRGTEEEELF